MSTYNYEYLIAIEIKKNDVDNHLELMQKIQQHPMPGLQGKILLAAVARMIIGEGVHKYAEKCGLFVLKPSSYTVKIMNDKKTFVPIKNGMCHNLIKVPVFLFYYTICAQNLNINSQKFASLVFFCNFTYFSFKIYRFYKK
ncbi:MAG: hypothetical protein NW207_11520 [Cytophagales bacterium]|nr:hypothetical protein [Cytophagales bacterium]